MCQIIRGGKELKNKKGECAKHKNNKSKYEYFLYIKN